MDRQKLIERFESEMAKVNRPGVDKLMEYIRKSDFYTAPASTKYHLACEGGLLQHSLNVLDALRGLMTYRPSDGKWEYTVAGKRTAIITDENVIVMALLHDLCKTYFYGVGTKNVKNEKTGKWEKAPYYTVDDKMPLGHGAKSAMIIKEYMKLENMEMYAIWWHMGFNGNCENDAGVGAAIEKYPVVLALQTADMQAAKIMESDTENKNPYNGNGAPEPPADPAPSAPAATSKPPRAKAKPKQEQEPEQSMPDFDESDFQEAPPLPPSEVNG